MRKLLLVLLVPIILLGVMGCGKGIDEGVQTDHLVQGAWGLDDFTLYISAAQMVVKYVTAVSTPYRTEWAYSSDPAASRDLIEGEMTVFDYKTNTQIATLTISCIPGVSLEILDPIEWDVEAYYYANAFPIVGVYEAMKAEGDAKDTEGEGEDPAGEDPGKDPGEEPETIKAENFTIIPASLVFNGAAKTITLTPEFTGTDAVNIKYFGVDKAGDDYGSEGSPMPTAPINAGEYTVIFDTTGTETYEAQEGLKITFTIEQYQLESADFEYTGDITSDYELDLDVGLIAPTWKTAGAISNIAADTGKVDGDECEVTFDVADSADGNCKGGTGLTVTFTVTD